MSKRFLVFVNVPEDTRTPNSLGDVVNILTGIDGGQVEGGIYVTDDHKLLERVEAIGAFMDDEDEDQTCGQVLSIIDRLMSDDWSGTGVYESMENVLDNALEGVDDIDETADSIHDPMN